MREPGFYWVKYSRHTDWEVARFLDNGTFLAWFTTDEMDNGPFKDADFDEIDERRIEREKARRKR